MIKEKIINIWENFEVTNNDIDFLFNRLFEIETPTNTVDLVKTLIEERIQQEKIRQENLQSAKGDVYLPKDDFVIGQKLLFPALDYKSGEIISIREGSNPELGEFSIIEVELSKGIKKEFASKLENHSLNQTIINLEEETDLDLETIFTNHKKKISLLLEEKLNSNQDLVQIAGYWFPRSLLIDINIGYLNLAEAVLEMAECGPLST
ncbi:MAG TPA: hypothetical protein VK856_03110, partial [Anaerolineaceae bacterium]|nr:hypothetical protein [Anaerolineaceae bacterium]